MILTGRAGRALVAFCSAWWISVPEARTPTTSETVENGAAPAEEAADTGTEPTEPEYDEPSAEA